MLQKVTFDIAGLFWISLDGNKVCLCINIYFFDTWKVSRLHQQFLTYDDMPAHRRDTSGETAQQNHRKKAHLKANCGRSLTRTTQQRQRRNEGRRKTEVIESGRISSARFSIFWKNVSATIYILHVWPGADVSAYFHVHRYHFWLSKISFFNSVFARTVKLIYQRV